MAAISMIVLAGCTKAHEVEEKTNTLHSFRINTIAPCLETDETNTKASMKATVRLQWKDGDEISVVNLSTGKTMLGNLTAKVNGDKVSFEGELSGSIKAGNKMAAIYPSQNYSGITNVPDFILDLSTQTCTNKDDLNFAAYSLFDCKTTGVVEVTSDFVVPVSFNQITLATIDPETKIDYVELTNVGNGISFHVNSSEGKLELTPSVGKVRITPQSKLSEKNGALFAYCALAESPASSRAVTVKALPKIYYATWAESAMSASKFYTSIASDFETQEYKDFMVSAPSSLELGYQGGTVSFSVTSNNIDWTASATPSLNIAPSSGKGCENLEVVVTVPQNDETAERSFLVTLAGGSEEYHFTINQKADPHKEIIPFADINLKKYMLAVFDDDEDGEINTIEAENIQSVTCKGRNISDLSGLERCPNLRYLDIDDNYVSEIVLPNLKKLETIIAYENPIEKIIVNNDESLKEVYLKDINTNILNGNTVNIDGYSQAEKIYIAFSGTRYSVLVLTNSDKLTSIDISENTQITKLIANGNKKVSNIDISSLTSLTDIDVSSCGLTELNVDNNDNISNLNCSNNKITSLILDNNVKLVNIDCSHNLLSSLRISKNIAVKNIDASSNNLSLFKTKNNTLLESLVLSGNKDLSVINVEYNAKLKNLDVSSTSLSGIDVSKNQLLANLNIANTPISLLDITNNPVLTVVNTSCCASLLRIDYSNSDVFVVGSVVVVDNMQSVVFQTSKIVSSDETTSIWTRASDWCTDHGQGWYFANVNVMTNLYYSKTAVNYSLSAIGGTLLGEGRYWSSSKTYYDNKYVKGYGYYSVSFSDGDQWAPYGNSSEIYYVRAIKDF